LHDEKIRKCFTSPTDHGADGCFERHSPAWRPKKKKRAKQRTTRPNSLLLAVAVYLNKAKVSTYIVCKHTRVLAYKHMHTRVPGLKAKEEK